MQPSRHKSPKTARTTETARTTRLRITSGTLRGRVLKSPKIATTHPMGDREKLALFNRIAPYLNGAHVLDLYCGSGALGLEALSRGAKTAVFVDRDDKAIATVKKNITALALEPVTEVIKGKVETLIARDHGAESDVGIENESEIKGESKIKGETTPTRECGHRHRTGNREATNLLLDSAEPGKAFTPWDVRTKRSSSAKTHVATAPWNAEGRRPTGVLDACRAVGLSFTCFDIIFCDPPYDAFDPTAFANIADFLSTDGIFVLSYPENAPELPNLALESTKSYARAHIALYVKNASKCP